MIQLCFAFPLLNFNTIVANGMTKINTTMAIIQSEYVEEVNPKDLIYGALRGMFSALDPYSQFMDPDTYNELKVETQGRFWTMGITTGTIW